MKDQNVYWAANCPAPLARDQQIKFMVEAEQRHAAWCKRITKLKYDEGNTDE